MVINILLAFFVWYCSTNAIPSEKEEYIALSFQRTTPQWGLQARQARSIRLYAIGGSNTRYQYYSDPILNYFKSPKPNRDWSGSMQRYGVGAVSPSDMIGIHHDFETWDLSMWPNIILLEFSVNVFFWTDPIENMDAIIQTIRWKYAKVGLPDPDFVFLELFYVRQVVDTMNSRPYMSINDKLVQLTPNSYNNLCEVYYQSYCPNYLGIRQVAEYYQYPIISWKEYVYNDFVRHVLLSTNTTYKRNPWKFCVDGMHITREGGLVLFDKLIVPFFEAIMAPRTESEEALVPIAPMFPPQKRWAEVSVWRKADVFELVREPTQWSLAVSHSEERTCSTNQSEKLYLELKLDSRCAQECHVTLNFMHSWNATEIGDSVCSVTSSMAPDQVLSSVIDTGTLDENGQRVKLTHNVPVPLGVSFGEGNYNIVCEKLDSRLTCLSSVLVLAEVEF